MKKTISILVLATMFSFTTNKSDVKDITISFTLEEVGIIYDALGNLPAKQVEGLRSKIVYQYQLQTDTTKKK